MLINLLEMLVSSIARWFDSLASVGPFKLVSCHATS